MESIRRKKKKLGDIVIEEIKRMIHDGELQEGDKLPNQTKFASDLGVSRPSLREALHTLTLMGVIEQKPGAGTILKSANIELWNEQPPPPMISDTRATLELLEARREIEMVMARSAVERITDNELKNMAEAIENMKQALDEEDKAKFQKEDLSFHYQIANASHNRYIIHMFVTIRSLMDQFMIETFNILPGLKHDSLKYHIAIYEAMKTGNKTKVVSYVKNHILDIENNLKRYYSAKK